MMNKLLKFKNVILIALSLLLLAVLFSTHGNNVPSTAENIVDQEDISGQNFDLVSESGDSMEINTLPNLQENTKDQFAEFLAKINGIEITESEFNRKSENIKDLKNIENPSVSEEELLKNHPYLSRSADGKCLLTGGVFFQTEIVDNPDYPPLCSSTSVPAEGIVGRKITYIGKHYGLDFINYERNATYRGLDFETKTLFYIPKNAIFHKDFAQLISSNGNEFIFRDLETKYSFSTRFSGKICEMNWSGDTGVILSVSDGDCLSGKSYVYLDTTKIPELLEGKKAYDNFVSQSYVQDLSKDDFLAQTKNIKNAFISEPISIYESTSEMNDYWTDRYKKSQEIESEFRMNFEKAVDDFGKESAHRIHHEKKYLLDREQRLEFYQTERNKLAVVSGISRDGSCLVFDSEFENSQMHYHQDKRIGELCDGIDYSPELLPENMEYDFDKGNSSYSFIKKVNDIIFVNLSEYEGRNIIMFDLKTKKYYHNKPSLNLDYSFSPKLDYFMYNLNASVWSHEFGKSTPVIVNRNNNKLIKLSDLFNVQPLFFKQVFWISESTMIAELGYKLNLNSVGKENHQKKYVKIDLGRIPELRDIEETN